jgi:hypothetical protein
VHVRYRTAIVVKLTPGASGIKVRELRVVGPAGRSAVNQEPVRNEDSEIIYTPEDSATSPAVDAIVRALDASTNSPPSIRKPTAFARTSSFGMPYATPADVDKPCGRRLGLCVVTALR